MLVEENIFPVLKVYAINARASLFTLVYRVERVAYIKTICNQRKQKRSDQNHETLHC